MSPRKTHFYLNIHGNIYIGLKSGNVSPEDSFLLKYSWKRGRFTIKHYLDDWKVSGVISELHCVDHRFDRDSVLPETVHAIPSLKITKNDLSVNLLGSDHEIEICVFLEIQKFSRDRNPCFRLSILWSRLKMANWSQDWNVGLTFSNT